MHRRHFFRLAAVGSAIFAVKAHGQSTPAKSLAEQLATLCAQYGFPGIAAAAVRGDAIVAEGVAGIRRLGEPDAITIHDRFAMASCTKKMTAAMVARLVDSGRLQFETTVAEALPQIPMRSEYRDVTIAQLLLFEGGIQPYMGFNTEQMPFLRKLEGSPREQREQFIKHILLEEPVAKPGTERHYSNASYALAAFVAEQRTGKSWEELMTAEVFEPLGMNTSGCGRPRAKDRPSEPTLHSKTDHGYEPEPDNHSNYMALVAPAGDAHCSIRDFAKFAAYELNAARGNNTLLKPGTAERWRALSDKRKPLIYPKDRKSKQTDGSTVKKKGPPKGSGGRGFFGGSNYVSSGCDLWPDESIAVVAAINAGSNNEAIRAAHRIARQAAM